MKINKHLFSLIAIIGFSIISNAQIPNYVPSNGLVGWWPFNGNANDESGNGNNGTVNGATLTNDRFGNIDQAYMFQSNDITINNYFYNNGWQDYSISLWFNTNNVDQQAQNFFNTYPHDGEGFGWNHPNSLNKISHWKNEDPDIHIWNIFSANPLNYNNVQTDNWVFLTIVKSNLVYNYYVNGQLDKVSIATLSALNQLTGLRFGSIGSAEFFNGKLDDFGIWNRAITECEIQEIYHSQLGSQDIYGGPAQSICAGDNVTLGASGGSNYQWNNNVVDGAPFAPTQSNAYVVNGTDSLGCIGSDTVVISVLENAASSLTQTALDSYTLNGQTYTQSGTYTQVTPAANGCDSTITLNLTLNFTGIHELGTATKILVKITDLNGKTIPRRKNTVMLFIYEDGTVERVVEME